LEKKKIVLITDAWHPQINGVVTTYKNIIQNLPDDVSIEIIHPGLFRTISVPGYKEIKLSLCSKKSMHKHLIQHPDAYYHIATEGPLGLQAKRVLDKLKKKYTTAYHTKFPEMVQAIYKIPSGIIRTYLNWFHKKSKFVICNSRRSAEENKFKSYRVLGKGYDTHFQFADKTKNSTKVLLYVGRVSKEKNIEDFCNLKIKNTTKIVVGGGPHLEYLKDKFPLVNFVGYKTGKELAQYYKEADVTVFPSKTDTFGIVVLESMACGTPVAAYNVTGPIDQIINGFNGYCENNLELAVRRCFIVSRQTTYDSVKNISWEKTAIDFVKHITE
jgi:glycosyltransferase involved in cell wall biosynthesis